MNEDKRVELVEKVAGAVAEAATGFDFVGGVTGFLRDPKAPAPVIPPDLHLVKPVVADADGNVPCWWCGAKVAWRDAQMIGSEGYSCGRHPAPAAQQPLNLTLPRRRMWPWAVGIVAAIAGAIALIWWHQRSVARDELARRYPIVASAGEQAILDRNVDRWRDGRASLVAKLGALPAIDQLHLGAACGDIGDNTLELDARDREDAARRIADIVDGAERGRFTSALSYAWVMSVVTGPVLAVQLAEDHEAKIVNRADPYYEAGRRSGTAYLLDADGTVRCAGAFEARSSHEITYDHYGPDLARDGHALDSTDQSSARTSLDFDLDRNTRAAIASSLRRVN